MNTQITWKKLSPAMQDKLVFIHKMEYCVEYPTPYDGKDTTKCALMRRGLVVAENNRLIVTKAGLAIIPQERITYTVYKQSCEKQESELQHSN